MSLRLFAGIPLPALAATQLTPLQRGVDGAAWRPTENFHITLRFFGDVDEVCAEQLDGELGRITAPPFDITISGSGWFGGSTPSALWLGVAHNASLHCLAERCEAAARRAGFVPESRKYCPHVTLAYCRGVPHAEAAKFAQRTSLVRIGPILVDRFYLYSSWLGKGPSRYVVEAEYPLLG